MEIFAYSLMMALLLVNFLAALAGQQQRKQVAAQSQLLSSGFDIVQVRIHSGGIAQEVVAHTPNEATAIAYIEIARAERPFNTDYYHVLAGSKLPKLPTRREK